MTSLHEDHREFTGRFIYMQLHYYHRIANRQLRHMKSNQLMVIEPAGRVLQVTCGLNRAEFHAHKYDRQISGEMESKLVSWKTYQECTLQKRIKYKVETIGDWLAKNKQNHSLNPFQDGQKTQEQINP